VSRASQAKCQRDQELTLLTGGSRDCRHTAQIGLGANRPVRDARVQGRRQRLSEQGLRCC
jgi:hypothetical protein